MRFALLLTCTACAWAQSGLTGPFLGQMIDLHGFPRLVYGMSGNFRVEAPGSERVLASACSRSLCLAKTARGLLWSGGVTPAPPGGAVIAPESSGATIYFSAPGEFARWQNGALHKLDLHAAGVVLSMASTPSGLNLAVERAGTIWIVDSTGAALDSLPTEATSVLLTPLLAIYSTPDSLVLRKASGSELRFPIPGVQSLSALSGAYVEARTSNALFGLRIVPGSEQLFQLPSGDRP